MSNVNNVNNVVIVTPEQKYSKDAPFCEPVVRCDGCAELILLETVKTIGMCPKCSSTKVKNVRAMNEEEMENCKKWAREKIIDHQWVALFEGMEIQE